MSPEIEKKLWELRLKVIEAQEKLLFEQSVKSTENKISGFADNGILMQPEAMQHMVQMLEHARDTNEKVDSFGRSRMVERVKPVEEDQESQAEGILARFGRSRMVSEETAADLVKKNIIEKKKNPTSPKEIFKAAMQELEEFLKQHDLQHALRCREEHLSDDEIDKMISESEQVEVDDPTERVKMLRQIKTMKKDSLYKICKQKPYQCLVCPYYYQDLAEFFRMKELRKEAQYERGTKTQSE